MKQLSLTHQITKTSFIILIFILATSFSSRKTSPNFTIDLGGGLEVKVFVEKMEDGNIYKFPETEVSPQLRLCQWGQDINSVSFEPEDGSRQPHVFEDFAELKQHPIKISLEHPEYIVMGTQDYEITDVECSNDPLSRYIIPQFYFESNWLRRCYSINDIKLTMISKIEAEKKADSIFANVEGSLDSQPQGGGSGGGPSSYDNIITQPKDSILSKTLRLWAREYSTLNENELSEEFVSLLRLFKKGNLKTLSRKLAKLQWSKRSLTATTFAEKRNLEQIATLAARTETLLNKSKKAIAYYDIADTKAPYQVPVKKEYVSYLIYKKDYEKAELVLKPGLVRTPFLKDVADLSTNLSEVYMLNNKNFLANQALDAAYDIRINLNTDYETKGISNQTLKEANYQQIKELNEIKTADAEKKKELKADFYQKNRNTYIYDKSSISTLPNNLFRTNRNDFRINGVPAPVHDDERILILIGDYKNNPQRFETISKEKRRLIEKVLREMESNPNYQPSREILNQIKINN